MFYDIGKRVLDILGAIVGIILFAPIMIIAAIWVKAVSPEGPVFADIPVRSGKDGKPFFMYKFRSMFPGSHEKMLADPVLREEYVRNNYKLDPDPRLIPGAGLMRKISIDEMPQFFNVFLGQMSLVGPRAYYVHELEEQWDRFPEARKDIEKLKTVKPGITGPWQVGGRSEIGFVDRARIDGEYADKQSLLYDIGIIIKTPYAVIRDFVKGRGAV
jgi:lipopolysaccharide/colanic/teichoic acid biosynthesis glycosyltransferase